MANEENMIEVRFDETRFEEVPIVTSFIGIAPRGDLPHATVRGDALVDIDADGNLMGLTVHWRRPK